MPTAVDLDRHSAADVAFERLFDRELYMPRFHELFATIEVVVHGQLLRATQHRADEDGLGTIESGRRITTIAPASERRCAQQHAEDCADHGMRTHARFLTG